MAGIYIHIPFCKQACHYCNFHFTTSLRHKNELVEALLKEISLREKYFAEKEAIETLYFGGGTPSLLHPHELEAIIGQVKSVYSLAPGAELTLEANPDDIDEETLFAWQRSGINRLSIGVQSFFEEDLRWMNRAHSAQQAIDGLQLARKHFNNITIDLIYGTPSLTDEKWKHNVDTAISLDIPHLSCYALTVEPRTPLQKMIRLGTATDVDPEKQSEQFLLLMDWLATAGYEHYEISNFAKPGFRSRHNSSYWQGEHYVGIGPSAHSYDGKSRQWNTANNNAYIQAIRQGHVPFEKETLTALQQTNEYIMTSLRTSEGLDITRVDEERRQELSKNMQKYIDRRLAEQKQDCFVLTKQGKLLADGIAADLFFT